MVEIAERRVHDLGGLEAGPVDLGEHDYAPWEKKVDAIMRLLVAKGVITVDELRRGIEELGPGIYDKLTYYERWIASLTNLLLEKRVVAPSEIGAGIAQAYRRREDGAA